MEEELESWWQKLSLTEEEDEKIALGRNSTKAAKEVGLCCLVMKILSRRSIGIDALRKNLRMVWKPNKGIQISEIDDEMFMVEFGDEKDKMKVLELCSWSYDKQLILLQEFKGDQPKEILLQWSPFWVQIHNLSLKCRTRETGRTIGSVLGEVIEVDVAEKGVQWSKCLRVRVTMDVMKKLLRGKKITIEGDEGRWVYFKYERLLNFCHNCGLLSHDLRDCSEIQGGGNQIDQGKLQYGAWFRGEIMRKSSREPIQKSNIVAKEKSIVPGRGCENQPERETVGFGDKDRIKERLPERCKSTGGNLESTLPPQESIDKGKEPKVVGKELQEVETLHERGKDSCADKQQESIF